MSTLIKIVVMLVSIAALIGIGVLAIHGQWSDVFLAIFSGLSGGLVFAVVEMVLHPLYGAAKFFINRKNYIIAFPLILTASLIMRGALLVWCVGALWYFTSHVRNLHWLSLAIGVVAANAPFAKALLYSPLPDDDVRLLDNVSAVFGCLIMAGMLSIGFSYLYSSIPITVMFAISALINSLRIFGAMRRDFPADSEKSLAEILRCVRPDFPVSRGSCEKDDPLVITATTGYVDIEYAVALAILEGKNWEFSLSGQAMQENAGRFVDVLTFNVKPSGANNWVGQKTFYFDITDGYAALTRVLREV